ncbi:hypothetical protein ALC57_18824, partial [Trachymyrmex cornetzi]
FFYRNSFLVDLRSILFSVFHLYPRCTVQTGLSARRPDIEESPSNAIKDASPRWYSNVFIEWAIKPSGGREIYFAEILTSREVSKNNYRKTTIAARFRSSEHFSSETDSPRNIKRDR